MAVPLTLGDELRAMRDRLKILGREHKAHTSWLSIAANEVGDALKELPRAVLAQPQAAQAPMISQEEVAHVKPPRGERARAAGGAGGGPAAAAPAADGLPERGGAASQPSVSASPPEALAPGKHRGGWGKQGEAFAALRDRWGVLSPAARAVVEMRAGGMRPQEIAEKLGRDQRSIENQLNNARRRLEGQGRAAAQDAPAADGEDEEPAAGSSAAIAAHRARVRAQAAPDAPLVSRVHAIRYLLDAPDAGPGIARCGAEGDVRVVGKRSMVTCPECLRLSAPPCATCGESGHVSKDCPHPRSLAKHTVRAYRLGERARVAAVVAQPIEVVVTQPGEASAEDHATPSPGRGELLADQRDGGRDDPAPAVPVDRRAWNRDDPDEDLTDLDLGVPEEMPRAGGPTVVAPPAPVVPPRERSFDIRTLGSQGRCPTCHLLLPCVCIPTAADYARLSRDVD